jgi:hypothetical protein
MAVEEAAKDVRERLNEARPGNLGLPWTDLAAA